MLVWAMAAVIAPLATDAIDLPRPGTVTIGLTRDDAAWDGPSEDPDDDPYVTATRDALGNAGFLVLPRDAKSRYVAQVEVSQEQRGSVVSKDTKSKPVTSIGGGVRVTLPSKKTSLQGLVVTRLTIEMRLRSDGELVWSGSALTTQIFGTKTGAPDVIAAKLATALIAQFPVTRREPVSIP